MAATEKELKDFLQGLIGVNRELIKGTDASNEYKRASDLMAATFTELTNAERKNAATTKNLEKYLGELSQESSRLLGIINKETAIRRELDARIALNAKSYTTLADSIAKAQSHMIKFASLAGAGAISMSSVKDILLSYNQAMFNFSRTQQVMGKGMGNLAKAFDTVEKSTTFSRRGFAEFMNIAAEGWKGIIPTSEAIADLAANLQEHFGPNVDVAKDKLKSFLDMQSKFPAMANTIMNVMKKGEKATIQERKSLIAQINASVIARKMDKKQAMDAVQMITQTTGSQKKQIKINQDIAKMSQSAENAMLNTGEAASAAMGKLTEALTHATQLLGSMPQLIIAIGTTWALMGKQIAGISTVPNMMSVPGIMSMFKKGGGGSSLPPLIAGGVGVGTSTIAAEKAASGTTFTPAGATPTATTTTSGTAVAPAAAGAAGTAVVGAGKFGRFMARPGVGIGVVSGAVSGFVGGMSEYDERRAKGQGAGEAAGAAAIRGTSSMVGGIAGGVVGTAVGGPIGGMIGSMVGSAGFDALGKLAAKIIPDIDSGLDKANKDLEKANNEAKDLTESMLQTAAAFEKITADYDAITEILQKTTTQQQEGLDILKEMGQIGPGAAKDLYDPMLKQMQELVNVTNDYFKNFLGEGGPGKLLAGMGVDLGANFEKEFEEGIKSGHMEGVIRGITEKATKRMAEIGKNIGTLTLRVQTDKKAGDTAKATKDQEDLDAAISEQKNMMGVIETLTEKQSTRIKQQADYVRKVRDQYNAYEEEMVKLNDTAQQRLDLEREVMESAQFGLGASIAMMQKQVDMAYQLMQVEQDRIKQQDVAADKAMQMLNLTGQQADQYKQMIKGAGTMMQAQKIIQGIAGDTKTQTQQQAAAAQMLVNYYHDQQDASAKILQQQKKIYDLTKEVREGYLDAIREMSTGAGEFEKIIGTQEMGVTQIMGMVNKINTGGEQNIMNTMKTGGQQSAAATAMGLGTNITGRYGAGGLSFMPGAGRGDSTEARNQRIRGYDKSREDFYKMQRGDIGPAMVGSGVAAGEEPQYIRPAQEEKEITYSGTKQALVEVFGGSGGRRSLMSGVNPGVGAGGYGHDERLSGQAYSFGAGVAGTAKAGTPADPRPFVNRMMPTPFSTTSAGAYYGGTGTMGFNSWIGGNAPTREQEQGANKSVILGRMGEGITRADKSVGENEEQLKKIQTDRKKIQKELKDLRGTPSSEPESRATTFLKSSELYSVAEGLSAWGDTIQGVGVGTFKSLFSAGNNKSWGQNISDNIQGTDTYNYGWEEDEKKAKEKKNKDDALQQRLNRDVERERKAQQQLEESKKSAAEYRTSANAYATTRFADPNAPVSLARTQGEKEEEQAQQTKEFNALQLYHQMGFEKIRRKKNGVIKYDNEGTKDGDGMESDEKFADRKYKLAMGQMQTQVDVGALFGANSTLTPEEKEKQMKVYEQFKKTARDASVLTPEAAKSMGVPVVENAPGYGGFTSAAQEALSKQGVNMSSAQAQASSATFESAGVQSQKTLEYGSGEGGGGGGGILGTIMVKLDSGLAASVESSGQIAIAVSQGASTRHA